MTTYGVETIPDLSFKAGKDLELALDLYLPSPRPANCPTLVYFHRGGWARGSRTDHAQERILPVVRNGVAVASASYRLIDQAIWPARLNDAAAVKFTISITGRFGLDPRRVGVWGASAGGHLACMLVLASPVRDLMCGAVAWFPPTDGQADRFHTRTQLSQEVIDVCRPPLPGKLTCEPLEPGHQLAALLDRLPCEPAGKHLARVRLQLCQQPSIGSVCNQTLQPGGAQSALKRVTVESQKSFSNAARADPMIRSIRPGGSI
jgi:carboxylesterase type B